MAIQRSDKFMGKPIAGAMERVLANAPKQEKETLKNAPLLEDFVFVPSIGLYVAKQKELHGMNWNDCQATLHSRGDKMLSPYEFVEFLKHLRTKKDSGSQTILDEIYKVAGNWRAEYLDAKFEKDGKKWFINYHRFSPQGLIEPVRESLAPCLMKDKEPGISLDDWLAHANAQGLPSAEINLGSLDYWAPFKGAVAGFGTHSGGAYLYCGRDPSYADSSLGVRSVRRKNKGEGK